MARGALRRWYAGVYSYRPGDLSREAEWMAAVLAAGGDVVLSHRSAAARTLIDLGDVLTPHQLAKVIDEAAYLGLFNLTETYEAMERANGRRNLGVLDRAIGLYIGGSAGTKSRNEDAFLACCGWPACPSRW